VPRIEEEDLSLKPTISSDYGPSFEQLAQIRVVELHNRGYRGRGVRIALLDNGFHYIAHGAFSRLQVVAERDFVNGDGVVADEIDQPVTGDERVSDQNIHGTQVLSLLAGYDPGRLIGVAPEAEYILAKTEDNGSELPVEEDRWIAGLEWADSLGADIVNSSLGYSTWDDGSGYTYEQLDGGTTLTTQAAAMAVQKDLILVVAAGNEGDQPWQYITAPADAPGVIAVGAVDMVRQEVAGFSSRGPTADGRIKPDVVAPGVGIVGVDVRRGDYDPRRLRGTSFAAPLVSGVCALLLQIHPSWGPERMLATLRETAADLGPAGQDTVYGWGLVDALRASGLEIELPELSLAGEPFPNPTRGNVVYFPLQLAEEDMVELRIFDTVGHLLTKGQSWRLVAGDYSRAEQALNWEIPPRFANGIYFYQLRTSAFSRVGKIALMRTER
jgi:subtilisin family serine protease